MADQPGVPRGLNVEPRHWNIIQAILMQEVPDREVRAFGSRVKASAKPHSDLDLVVMGDVALDIATQARLNEAFAESDLPWRVDVVDWATTSEAFRELIQQHTVVLQQGR